MSKKQIEELKDCIDSLYGCECAYYGVEGLAIAEALYNAGYRKQSEPFSCDHEKGGWISVDERLPCDTGEPEEYLVMLEHAHSPTVAMFYGGRFAKSAFCKCTVLGSKVTHWMPLPEPPVMKGE